MQYSLFFIMAIDYSTFAGLSPFRGFDVILVDITSRGFGVLFGLIVVAVLIFISAGLLYFSIILVERFIIATFLIILSPIAMLGFFSEKFEGGGGLTKPFISIYSAWKDRLMYACSTPVLLIFGSCSYARSFSGHLSVSPLFIAAQVATHEPHPSPGRIPSLSVPSSSGHRLLQRAGTKNVLAALLSVPFSSGRRLLPRLWLDCASRRSFQSPFHRGNGCYYICWRNAALPLHLSVPFSSGQRLLHRTCRRNPLHPNFQSPFHRGNGCYRASACCASRRSFQSPFHRGNGCYISASPSMDCNSRFQSPFHRGNGATQAGIVFDAVASRLSVPFHRGNGCYRLNLSPFAIG